MPPREAATDEMLGQVVVGGYEVSVYRRAGAVLARTDRRNVPASPRRLCLPALPEFSDLPPLLDREIELAAIQSLLRASPPPVVEVSGRSGVGKTALVRSLSDALYIDAAGLSYRAFLQCLYERAFQADVVCSPSVDRLRGLFSAWKTPVVIDGFEGSARELHTILDILKRVPVVYTSVEPLHLDSSVSELRLAGLRPEAARELFERCFGASIADDPDVIEFVNVVLHGNPLLIGHAAALARAGALVTLQAPEPLAALTFNTMTIGEQQIFAVIAGFGGARIERAMAEAVSEVGHASAVMNALLARRILQTDGDCVWISPLMRPVLSAGSMLLRYDAQFAYMDAVFAQPNVPRSVIENPQPFFAILRHAEAKGHYAQVARNGRALADALLLAGKIDEARTACALVRSAANEVYDAPMQAWAQHQLGTLSALAGDSEEGLSWLESAEILRDRIGDAESKLHSQKNAEFLRKAPTSKKAKKKSHVVWDIALFSWAIGLVSLVAMGHGFGWSSLHGAKSVHAHARVHTAQTRRITALPAAAHAASLPVFIAPPITIAAPFSMNLRPTTHHQRASARVVKRANAVPRISAFTTSARRVTAGGSAALCFKIADADSAFLEPVGKLNPHAGCVREAPRVNTYYTLYAYNQNGMTSASVYVDVSPANSRAQIARETRVP